MSLQVPAGAARVDLTGKTVMPAKVDLHGHIGYQHDVDGTMAKEYFTRENLIDHLQRLAYYGFSAVVSVGDLVDRSDLHGGRTGWGDVPLRVREEIIPGAALFRTTGTGISYAGAGPQGHPSRTDVPYQVTTVEEARAGRAGLRAHEAGIHQDLGGRSERHAQDADAALVSGDCRGGAQAQYPRRAPTTSRWPNAKLLMRAGVEGWLHLPVRMGEVPDDELIGIIKDRIARNDRPNMWFNPGAGTGAASREDWNDPLLRETISPAQIQAQVGDQLARITPQSVERARQNLKTMGANNALKLRAAGMKIVNGSDTGQTRFFIGWAGQLEFEHWVLMGLTPAEAIVAATRDSAEAAHINTGMVAAGKSGRFHRPRRESSREHRELATDQQGLPPGPGGRPRRDEGQVAGGVESRDASSTSCAE